ncbi:MAG: hypothetical protein VBE63_08435 [Lamprobacter sp.]|uniref:hypothetical protein n=1 Tax=Lamprobacter sp. TaxID=3100796 RepID=UPI002B25A9ED|nr:hypothetical protein [Lamprobacter sp.]MEA3639957.1 hypothetical protein [Lamprobacter sp.]
MTDFVATKTIWEFINDDSFVRVLMGPIGSGKSVACCHEILHRAIKQAPNSEGVRKTRWGIVRNTVDQLRSTTLKTLFDWIPPGVWGVWKASEKVFYIDVQLPDSTRVKCEIQALALDHPDDVRKALSLELTGVFINETREVAPEVIDGLLMRLRRYPSMKDGGPTWSGAILDTNPPDQDTHLFHVIENPPENWSIHVQPPAILNFEEYFQQEGVEPDEEDGTTDARGNVWWLNPQADNLQHLDPQYYPGVVPGKSQDFIDVYLRCRYGRSLSGLPVYEKTFSPDFHIATEPFTALKSANYPLIVGLDFGRTPAAAICQRNTSGQLVVLDELTSENMGIETFISKKLGPRLGESDLIGCHVVIAPDPAGWAKQQIGEVSPVDVIKAAGYQVVRPNTNDPERRIEAVERVLLDHIEGKPAFVINPTCTQLIKGFRYGYKYKVNKQGVQDNRPLKDEHSHLADACQYAVLVADNNPTGGSILAAHRRREIKPRSALGWT